MRWFAWCVMMTFAFAMGCSQPVETIPSVTAGTSGVTDTDDDGHTHADGAGHEEAEVKGEDKEHATEGAATEVKTEAAKDEKKEAAKDEKTEAAKEEGASNQSSETIRFVSDKSINVPDMMCPYSCWPKVRDTLAAQAGVEAVQLATQPEGTPEGEIKERVVELKLNGDFDINAAVAALGKIDFKAEVIN